MSDLKLTALPAEPTPDLADVLYLVVDVGGTPASRQVTVADLLALVDVPTTTDELTEGASNLYFSNERVDDRVAALLVAGSNITLNYNDPAGTITITAASGGVTDHGALTGLGDDDHAQYAMLAGRGGGQTVRGGTAAGENLTLESTSHATKGRVYLTSKIYADGATGMLVLTNGGSTISLSNSNYDLLIISPIATAQFRMTAWINDIYFENTADGILYFRTANSGKECARLDGSITPGDTRLLLWDVTAGAMKRVTVGAADSGGIGYKVLRIAN